MTMNHNSLRMKEQNCDFCVFIYNNFSFLVFPSHMLGNKLNLFL